LERRILKLPLDKGNKLKERSWSLPRERRMSCVGGRGKEEHECVKKKITFYMWKGVVHGKDVCKK
jgi:hypothetical protein